MAFRTRRLAVMTLALLAMPATAQGARDPSLDRAKAIRESDPDGAERIIRAVLARAPNDYYALYNLGLVEYARAVKAPEGPERLAHYRQSANLLEQARGVRVAQNVPDATIFNTLGVVYLATGDLGLAQSSFDDGIRNKAQLTQASLGKLYANIGYLAAVKGRPGAATRAFASGVELGDPMAMAQSKSYSALTASRPKAPMPMAVRR